MLFKKIKPDCYLKKFIEYCKEKYKNNLLAIIIYGSYAWGYFDKRKSDYDVFVIFKEKIPKSKKSAKIEFSKKFPKITLQYYCTADEIIHKVNKGHWTTYITLLKSGRVLYKTKDYKKFLKSLKKIKFMGEILDAAAIEYNSLFEIKELQKFRGYEAAKWALPCIRKRLQFLTYIKKKKTIWNLRRIIKMNKKILTKEERKFLLNLDNKVKSRSAKFVARDKKIAVQILERLNHEILNKELSNLI